MVRRPLSILPLLVLVALAGLALDPGALAVASPLGPRLVFFEAEYVSTKEGSKAEPPVRGRYVSTDPQGHDARTFGTPPSVGTAALRFDWSADGSEYAFVDSERAYVARADGSRAHAIAGTAGTTAAVLSPDGAWLAFTRTRLRGPKVDPKHPKSVLEALIHGYETRSTWIVSTHGGAPRRLTPWGRHEVAEPTSFSPDGSTLLVTAEGAGLKDEVEAIELANGKRRDVELEASEATYSPDGSRIAFISYRDRDSVPGFDEPEATSEVYTAAADGTGAHRITHTPSFEETAPTWDPSGERLAYLRSPGGMFGILFGRVAESSVDGSCTKVLAAAAPRRENGHMLLGEPSWWPGPDRGAGPLSCGSRRGRAR